jgi:tetratricopeptide (TPR) repeat protein
MPITLARSGLLALLIAGGSASAPAQEPVRELAPLDRPERVQMQGQSRPPARAPQAQKPVEPAPEEGVRKPVLDELFDRLAAAKDEEEADGIAGAIERVFQRSGSDTADLLMSRALSALHRKENKAAVDVLDKLVAIEPQWAEAWSQRATARFMDGDRAGAVEDLGHALSREPRHFGALAGLGSILYNLGFEKRALEVFRRSLAVRPHQSEVRQMIDKLAPDVDGRDI